MERRRKNMFTAETIAQMSSWNTVITFFLLVSLCCAGIGFYISTIIEGIVILIKSLIRKIRKKEGSSDENKNAEH